MWPLNLHACRFVNKVVKTVWHNSVHLNKTAQRRIFRSVWFTTLKRPYLYPITTAVIGETFCYCIFHCQNKSAKHYSCILDASPYFFAATHQTTIEGNTFSQVKHTTQVNGIKTRDRSPKIRAPTSKITSKSIQPADINSIAQLAAGVLKAWLTSGLSNQ